MHAQKELLNTIISFITEIGIDVETRGLNEQTFLPGVKIDKGTLTYDPDKLLYPGDLLHEAGHIAVMTGEQRKMLSGDIKAGVENDIMGDEIAAILWSFAAARHIGLPLDVVFHPNGYKGASDWHINNFKSKNYVGLPLLVWMGMTHDPAKPDPQHEPFPHMQRWLRE